MDGVRRKTRKISAPTRDNLGLANNRLVLDVIERAARPPTAYDIVAELNVRSRTTPPTVYRALDRLIKEGSVHRIERLNAYVPCTCMHRRGELHVLTVCTVCGSIEEFALSALAPPLQKEIATRSFRLTSTMIELAGVCARCR